MFIFVYGSACVVLWMISSTHTHCLSTSSLLTITGSINSNNADLESGVCSAAGVFHMMFLSSNKREEHILSSHVTQQNWGIIFSRLCWPEAVSHVDRRVCLNHDRILLDDNPVESVPGNDDLSRGQHFSTEATLDGDCCSSAPDDEVDDGQLCSLMDMFLSMRHYHPDVGFSRWSQELINVIPFPAVSSESSNGIPLYQFDPLAAIHINSSNSIMPQHQIQGITGILTLLCLFGAAVIYIAKNDDPESKGNNLSNCFDFKSHFRSIFSAPPRRSPNQDRFVFFDGIRVISMLWVLQGHSVLYWVSFQPFNRAKDIFDVFVADPSNYVIFAAVFAVDNFLFISGLLGGSNLFQLFAKNCPERKNSRAELLTPDRPTTTAPPSHRVALSCTGCTAQPTDDKSVVSCISKTIPVASLCVFQRYVRLMGVTASIIFINLALNWSNLPHPAGARFLQATNIACYDAVPSILGLINNLSSGEFMMECFGWTWYLATDFQFFILGLVLTILFVVKPTWMNWILPTIIMISIVSSTHIAYVYNLSVNAKTLGDSWRGVKDHIKGRQVFPLHPIMDYYYVKPYVRVAPYLVGLYLGIILARSKIISEFMMLSSRKRYISVDDKAAARVATSMLQTTGKSTSDLADPEGWINGKLANRVTSKEDAAVVRALRRSSSASTTTTSSASTSESLTVPNSRMNSIQNGAVRSTDELSDERVNHEPSVADDEQPKQLSVAFVETVEVLKLDGYRYDDGLRHNIQHPPAEHLDQGHFDKRSMPPFLLYFVDRPGCLLAIGTGLPAILVLWAHLANVYSGIKLHRELDAIYMGIHRPIWGISLACWTLLLLFGHSSSSNLLSSWVIIIRDVLSHRLWAPLAELSFSIYLIHPLVLVMFYGSGYGPSEFDRGRLFGCFICICVISVAAACFVYVFLEAPFKVLTSALAKSLTSRRKKNTNNRSATPAL